MSVLFDMFKKRKHQQSLLSYFLFACGNGALPGATDYKDGPRTFLILLGLGVAADEAPHNMVKGKAGQG